MPVAGLSRRDVLVGVKLRQNPCNLVQCGATARVGWTRSPAVCSFLRIIFDKVCLFVLAGVSIAERGGVVFLAEQGFF
jgi:hypothetical protein